MKKGRTELLYYLDVYQKSAKAQVLEVQHDAQGTWLCSDQTIFYPGGGGQLPDRGTIQNYSIEDIRSADDGIWHSVPGFSGTVGQTVQMELDWERRHYMMQQHSGQHLISHVAMDHDLKRCPCI